MFARSADELTRLHGFEHKPGGPGTSGSWQGGLGGQRPPNVPIVCGQRPHKETRNVRAERGRADTAAWCRIKKQNSRKFQTGVCESLLLLQALRARYRLRAITLRASLCGLGRKGRATLGALPLIPHQETEFPGPSTFTQNPETLPYRPKTYHKPLPPRINNTARKGGGQ